jgi:hypothetical protein
MLKAMINSLRLFIASLALGFTIGFHPTASAALDPRWEAIECLAADLPPEELFETVRAVDDFEAESLKWTAERGVQNAQSTVNRDLSERHGGRAALRVDYDFVGKKDYEYIQVNGKAEFAQPGLGFGFWLKHDGTPFVLRLRFTDISGECHQTELLYSAKPGWQYVAGTLDGPSTSWGGDGNHRKDYPCKLAGICIDRPKVGFVGKGSLWIDDAAVVRPRPKETRALKVEVRGRRFGNLYSVGDSVALRAGGPGDRIRWSVVDAFDRPLAEGAGAATNTEAAFPLARPGWFCCKLELLAGGRAVAAQLFPCAALPGGAEIAPSDFLGMCSHFGQNAYPLESMALMRRYGIDQFRDEVSWGSYETQKGRLAMPGYAAAYLKRAAELKMRPLIIFDYANRFYDQGGYPNSPEAIAAFAAYAVDLARQTRGTVGMFEIWNEWVGGCGMNGRPGAHDGEAYGRLLKPTYEAVKKAFPDLTVVGIGGEYGPKCADNILGALKTAGPKSMDAWSIHPYRYPRPPEESDLVGEVGRIAGRVAEAGAMRKAWITEIGYPTHRTSGGSDLQAQARHAVRTLALLQFMRGVEKVFWYDFKDDGLTREYNEHNFGVVYHQRFDCAPKPAIVAMSAFIRLTAGAKPVELKHQAARYTMKYRRADGSDLLLLWTTAGEIKVNPSGHELQAHDLMGAPLPDPASITVNPNPVYVSGREITLR